MNFRTSHLLAALALHVLIFAALIAGAMFHRKVVSPPVMVANLIAAPEQTRAPPEPPAPVRPPPEPTPQEPPEPSPEEQQQRKQDEQQRLLREQEAAEKQAELKLKADAERRRQDENRKKQEALRREKEKQQADRKALEEARRQMMEEAEREAREIKRARAAEEKRRRDELAAQLAAEQAAREAEINAGKLADWGALIAQRIRKFWTKPPGTADRFSCLVTIEQAPGGEVVSARIARSCGNPALDRSVEQAVLKASPLPPPPDPSTPFQRIIRSTFCPGADMSSCN